MLSYRRSVLRFRLFLRTLKGFHFDGRVIRDTKWTFQSDEAAEGGRNSQKRWSSELFLRRPDRERMSQTHKSQLKWSSGGFLDMMHWFLESHTHSLLSKEAICYITFCWTLETCCVYSRNHN